MRIVAVDPGSHRLGLALFEGERCVGTAALGARDRDVWLERMRELGRKLRDALVDAAFHPDVVAIEDVVLHGSWMRQNPKTLVTMAETRGFLLAVLAGLFPAARFVDVNPSSARAAVGAPRRRALAKQHNRWAVESLVGRTGLSEDENDAVVVGLAAIARLKRERIEAGGLMNEMGSEAVRT